MFACEVAQAKEGENVSTDPELADAPDTPQDIAWEIRHCAARLDSLNELAVPDEVTYVLLEDAAFDARNAANRIDGRQP